MVEGRVVELRDPGDRRLLGLLINKYHRYGFTAGLSKNRYFVYVVDEDGVEYWIAGMVLQDPSIYANVLVKHKIPLKRSYFIRRITRFMPRSLVGDILSDFIEKVYEKIKNEGKECLITFGYNDPSNLYEKSKMKKVGVTKSGKPIYIRCRQ